MSKSKMALAGSLGVLALITGAVAGFAAAFDSGLIGAWTTSAPDCAKIFQRSGGGLVYRQPVDRFAQAAIIGPQQILLPSSTCNVRSAVHEKGVIKVTADCRDSISYTTQTVQIKVQSPGEIIYSPTGDPALDTAMVKCRM
jgi:hypothetical protein